MDRLPLVAREMARAHLAASAADAAGAGPVDFARRACGSEPTTCTRGLFKLESVNLCQLNMVRVLKHLQTKNNQLFVNVKPSATVRFHVNSLRKKVDVKK